MCDYIEREKAIKAVCDCMPHTCYLDDCDNECQEVSAIISIPAADVRPVVRGKWKYRGQQVIDDLFPTYACSVCHDVIPADWRRKCNFCPNCGADMREES